MDFLHLHGLKNAIAQIFKGNKKLQKSYNVLLLGETGAGKSTLVNYLTNFFEEGSLDDLKISIPTRHKKATQGYVSNEKDLKNNTKSKTALCTKYAFTFEEIKFNFVDTPGLSDTGGVKKDDENIAKIIQAAEGCGKLAAVIIVINGTVARATSNLRNTLVRMKGSMPDVILHNLLVVLTNCSEGSCNFEMKSLKPWVIPKEHIFYMDNSALSKDPRKWNAKVKKEISRGWDDSMDTIRAMVIRISELGRKSSTAFKDMRESRETIKAEVHVLLLEIKKLQTIQNEIEDAEVAEKGAANDVQRYSNYKQNKEVDYITLVDSSYHSTLCMVHSEVACHDHCGLVYTEQAGTTTTFSGCACMGGQSLCRVCECTHDKHYHAMKKPQKEKKTVEEIMQDVKDQFDLSSTKWGFWKNKKATLAEDMKGLKKALKVKEEKIKECCERLKKICSAFNFVSELKSVTDTMEANARTLTSVKAREEADTMIDHIKVLADRLTKTGMDGGSDAEEKEQSGDSDEEKSDDSAEEEDDDEEEDDEGDE